MLHVEGLARGQVICPLYSVTLHPSPQTQLVEVRDGAGHVYLRRRLHRRTRFTFRAGGAAGVHVAVALDADGQTLDVARFRVEAATRIQAPRKLFSRFLTQLESAMRSEGAPPPVQWNGRIFRLFQPSLREHVWALHGMKYFAAAVKEGLDLHHEAQREDGMIWNSVALRPGHRHVWDERLEYGDFIRPFDDQTGEFRRTPTRNDTESAYVEGVYAAWKASGDDGWMAARLDSAMRALDYAVSSAYRWSPELELLHRACTIDLSDEQSVAEAKRSNDQKDPLVIQVGRTRFGIMFGDNTAHAAACHHLAEMLRAAGEADQAQRYDDRAAAILDRINQLAWDEDHFIHHVAVEEGEPVAAAAEDRERVSISNALSLQRGLSEEQAVAILRRYQELRRDLPDGSPGEWYTIHPPFDNDFGGRASKWEGFNGGVTPLAAGVLALGAFEHGLEEYGADILQRLARLADRGGGTLRGHYRGAAAPAPGTSKPKLKPLDISARANTDFVGEPHDDRPDGVAAWTGEGDNDLQQIVTGRRRLAGIPWRIPSPSRNGRRGCIGLSVDPAYAPRVDLPLRRRVGSIYLLHACAHLQSDVAGILRWIYADGTEHVEHVLRGAKVSHWWLPEAPGAADGWRADGAIAWEGVNPHCRRVGLVAAGFDNPHPDRTLKRIALEATPDGGLWLVAGVTTGDGPYFFPPSGLSCGIPDASAAGMVTRALLEGLAGVTDLDAAFRSRVQIAPRWIAAGMNRASAMVHLPASQGYVAYEFKHLPGRRQIGLLITTSASVAAMHVLLPKHARSLAGVTADGQEVPAEMVRISRSRYARFELQELVGPADVMIRYDV